MTDDAEPRPAGDRTLTWWPIAGAGIVALLVIALLVFAGSGKDNHLGTATDDDGALSCPKVFEISDTAWVPIAPSGIDGSKHLVPDTAPSHVTVCHYPTSGDSQNKTQNAALDGHKTLGGTLKDVTDALSKIPARKPGTERCGVQSGDGSYLMGLTFATGVVWVTAPGDLCLGSTNGDLKTESVHGQLEAAFEAGRWVS